MKKTTMITALALASSTALGVALGLAMPSMVLPALAFAASPSATEPVERGGWREPERLAMLCQNLDAGLAGVLSFAKAKLDIKPAQAGDWDRFTLAAGEGVEPIRRACATLQDQASKPLTVPARLDALEVQLAAALDSVHALAPAAGQLYQALLPEQRQTLDRMLKHPR